MTTYVVTGANRGLGLEWANQLAARGDTVIGTARQPREAKSLAALDVRVERLDVADGDSVSDFAKRLAGEPVDALIHNAAIGAAGPGLGRLDVKDFEQSFRTNSIGPLHLTQALLPSLRAGSKKQIVGISSGLASISLNTSGGWYAYRASKAALNQLIRTLAEELRGFTCVVLCPGWVKTDMGGRGAELSAEQSVSAMLRLLDRLQPSDTGQFLDRFGKPIPW